MTIPRRIRVDQMTPAELACRDAVHAIEVTGGHPLLTEAQRLAMEAQSRVADFVDKDDPEQAQFIGYPKRVKSGQIGWTSMTQVFPGYANVRRDGTDVVLTVRSEGSDGDVGTTSTLRFTDDEWRGFFEGIVREI